MAAGQGANIIHHALFHAVARFDAQPYNVNIFGAHLADDCANLMRTYIQPYYQVTHAVL